MFLQNIAGRDVYTVYFDTMPEMPITWDNDKEKPYAKALQNAIQEKVITEPGMYGIELFENVHAPGYLRYDIYTIIEK